MRYRYWCIGKPLPRVLPVNCEYRVGDGPWHIETEGPDTWSELDRRWPIPTPLKKAKATHEYPLLEKVIRHCDRRLSKLLFDQSYTRKTLEGVVKLCNELMGK